MPQQCYAPGQQTRQVSAQLRISGTSSSASKSSRARLQVSTETASTLHLACGHEAELEPRSLCDELRGVAGGRLSKRVCLCVLDPALLAHER
ncbi:hypothetical protein SLE2022_258300 [Rubroshorea leprosula]